MSVTIVTPGTVATIRSSSEITEKMSHINTTPEGVALDDLNFLLKAERAPYQVCKSLFFGASQSLLAASVNYHKLITVINTMKETNREGEARTLENSKRYLSAKERAENAAKRAAIIHTFAEDIPVEFEPTMKRGSDKAQLKEKADWAGVSVEHLTDLEQKQANRMFLEQQTASSFAESLFWSVDTEATDEEGFSEQIKIYVNPHQVLKALYRTRDWILTWSKPDLAELGLLRYDIAMLEEACVKFAKIIENSHEASRDLDDAAATSQDLAAGNAG